MSRKYFIYISSTQDDLRVERRELTKIVSELGAIPITMDAFYISNEDDRKFIWKAIEECDYFLSLIAYKGGPAVDRSFALEAEYSCAVKAGIPVLALVIGDKARWKASKKEKDPAAAEALGLFKNILKGHTHDTWMNLADLKQKSLALLTKEMNLHPRLGWVPSSRAAEPVVANELGRLIRENELFRCSIKSGETDLDKIVNNEIKHSLRILAANKISLSFYYIDGDNWENATVFRYLKLFRLLAPELTIPRTASEISLFLGNILNPDLSKTVRKDYPTPSNTIKKLMVDFDLLKLVRNTGVQASENGVAWIMTEFGKEVFAYYRMRQMSAAKKRTAGKREKTGDTASNDSSPNKQLEV